MKTSGYIVVTGPHRVFDSEADAAKAAEEDSRSSGVHHVVMPVTLCDGAKEPKPRKVSVRGAKEKNGG